MSLAIEDGFAALADWAPHARCWMAWPNREAAWTGHLEAAREAVAGIANVIAGFEPVAMIANPEHVAETSLLTGARVSQVSLAQDDCWMRDMGPTFVADAKGEIRGIDWRWNAWGGRFADFARDAEVAKLLLEHLSLRRYESDLAVEGGSLALDGEGTLIVTEAALLDPKRNPDRSKAEIEQRLIGLLGIRQVIWLGEGLQDDLAGGHVENLAAFLKPNLVIAATCADPADPNHKICADNLARLKAARDASGALLEIAEIDLPRPRFDQDGRRLALSYVNFYMPDGALILPAFEDGAADKRAYDLFVKLAPERRIVQVPAIELSYGGGGIRSLCLPQPK